MKYVWKIVYLDEILQLCNTKIYLPIKNHYYLWDLLWYNSNCMVNLKENIYDIFNRDLIASRWLIKEELEEMLVEKLSEQDVSN